MSNTSGPQAASNAQTGEKTFPAATDPSSITMAPGPAVPHGGPLGDPNHVDPAQLSLTQAAYGEAMSTQVVSSQRPVQVGTPHHPEIRQVRPDTELGAGYRPAADTDPR